MMFKFKKIPTCFALVFAFTFMNVFYVSFKMTRLGIRFFTKIAFIIFLTFMNISYVLFHVGRLTERFFAPNTCIILFSFMNISNVNLIITWTGKCFGIFLLYQLFCSEAVLFSVASTLLLN